MNKYTKSEEMIVCDEDKITFENKSDSNYLVSTGITFKKSGLYNVLVESKRTVISKVADSQTGWIPVSERLPDLHKTVIYSLDVKTYDGETYAGYRTDRNYIGEVVEPYWADLETGIEVFPNAWMPMPKPYKAESEDKE